MAKKKRSGAVKKRKKKTKKIDHKKQFMKIVAGMIFLAALVLTAGLTAHHFLLRKQPLPKTAVVEPINTPAQKPAHHTRPVYEVFEEDKTPPVSPEKPRTTMPVSNGPVVALIIDDMGYDKQIAEKFMTLDVPLTFSMLPEGTFNTTITTAARKKGIEIMLHLPMEPNEYPRINPGPGALLTSMSPDQLIAQLNTNLTRVPYLKGVNNHMGSKMTTSSEQMRQVFSILKKNNLFFIDSRTTKETICRSSAELLQIPFGERDIFLDHLQDKAFIEKQVRQLIKRAHRQGFAIGIAHPHPITYDVLKASLPELKEKVKLTTASAVVGTTG